METSQRVKIQRKKKKNKQEKELEVAPPGFETAPQLPPAQMKKSEVSYY